VPLQAAAVAVVAGLELRSLRRASPRGTPDGPSGYAPGGIGLRTSVSAGAFVSSHARSFSVKPR
jgi:hypothetical protein